MANNSFASFMQIVFASTLTPIEFPSINLNRSPLNVAWPCAQDPDLFMAAEATGYVKLSYQPATPPVKLCFSFIDWLFSP